MKKNMRMIIIGAMLITAALFGAYWLQQYLQHSRASAAPPTASFTIAGPKVNPGASFNLTLQVNPNLTPFSAFNVAFTYPEGVSPKFTDAANLLSNIATNGAGLANLTLLTGAGSTSIDTNSRTIRITAIPTSGDPFTGREIIKMVTISFVMKTGYALPLEFRWIDPDPKNSFEKVNLDYTGEEPTATPKPTDIPAVGVPTNTPTPTVVQPTGSYNSLTPVPTIIGGSGTDGTTKPITERADLLYINSLASYQSPFRYEQPIKLEKGTYTLTIGAKVWVRRGRGMEVALMCNETTCGTKKQYETIYVSPVFPAQTTFSEMSNTVTIPDDTDGKALLLRIFCEDGSECELDYISLQDAWGSERIQNPQFDGVQNMNDPRKQPASWAVDSTANLYGSIDPAFGKNGALMINNSAK